MRRFFLLGIVLKGIDGALEIVGGTLLLFVSNATIYRLLILLTSGELAEDPKDLTANYLVRLGQHLSLSTKTFASVYLIGHGLVKIVLVANLLRNRLWAYPAAIAVMLGFIGYQVFRLDQQFSAALAAFTLIDVIIVALIWSEYRVRSKRPERGT